MVACVNPVRHGPAKLRFSPTEMPRRRRALPSTKARRPIRKTVPREKAFDAMQLTLESYRVRWVALVACWAVAAAALLHQAGILRDYLDMTSGLGLRGQPTAVTPFKQIYPVFAADALVWVRHSAALVEGNELRLRKTSIDNAPAGREVHWNSAWAWAIAGAGWVHHLFTGNPLLNSIERATVWLNPITLLALTVIFSAWVSKRGGLSLGVFVAIAMSCGDRFYEGFFPGYVDHHGLLTVTAFGTMMGAVFMGAGWWQARAEGETGMLPASAESARSAACFSAISGACGLWVSAASAIPPVGLVGFAGAVVILIQGRHAQRNGARFDGMTWRIWGRVGGAASLFFYLLEYFPNHLSMRLEPNHPLHALAWLGAGELIAQWGERWTGTPGERWGNLVRLVWPALAVAAVPVAVLMGGQKFFVVLDPFMSRLHNDYIQEFLPIWRTIRGLEGMLLFQVAGLGCVPLIAGIATLTYLRRDASIVLWFATIAAGLFILMAVAQSRWLLNSSGVQVCLMMVTVSVWTVRSRVWVRWLAVVIVASALYLQAGISRTLISGDQVKTRQVSPKDAGGALSRDIAAVLRSSQPTGEMTVLASPNASTTIGYYGRFKTLGTLYWENSEGLKAAARLHAAKSEEEAAALIRQYGVTHIALVFEENFIEQYHQLLYPKDPKEELKKTFGYRLLQDKVVPQWLQMIPYKVPDDLAQLKPFVMLFKVNFNQTMPEALYHIFENQLVSGEVAAAERTLDRILRDWPNFWEPYLRKAELLAGRKSWVEASQTFLRGVALAPADKRPGFFANFASTLYNNEQHLLAIEIYRAALQSNATPDLASYLAWIFATSKIEGVRNGQEALNLAQQVVQTNPTSSSYLSVLSAAYAELGRMPEAVAAADQSVANARLRNDPNTAIFEQRLAALRAGQPLRY
ncbi:MAG: tetratricopeptide repeat protein [Opitutaceae bacterium]|nr:tetratricopeptide repeat protein [Opitutaceae bacterium]